MSSQSAISAPQDRQYSSVEESPTNDDAMLKRIVDHCDRFRGSALSRSLGQLTLNLFLYFALLAAIFFAFKSGAWLAVVALALPAAGMLVRLFIIQHDCGHGSYFQSKQLNHAVGWGISLLTFTPFGFWRDAHNRHHASSGNLTRRGMGGVDTLTVSEFEALSPVNKALYKFYRHPMTLLIIGPPVYFIFLQRLPSAGPMPYSKVYLGMKGARIWNSVMLLNASLLAFYGLIGFAFGFAAMLIIFGLVVSLAGIIGTWLFFIQHQYEDAYWEPQHSWNYTKAALYGSSHYDLPPLLQWFTGNIGLHHIHHLCSLIPNYKLQECYDASADLQKLPRLSFAESLGCAKLALWDESQKRLVSFASLKG
ncbi:MAG: fatty acid desaturase [Marinicaulis sp.]|nr:fatty acid desaturase [Marinicaulis sp.]NNE39809.1 fatty acid desaturase [Marinicaulis sp.]NNL90080.1 fatty acid desaturase [Marinicaulis sp.]